MLYCARFYAALLAVFMSLLSFNASALTVVASIPPLAMISDSLLQNTDGKTLLLVDGKQSPHGMTLLPSQRATLAKADLVLWVGADFESWLVKSLQQSKTTTTAMADVFGIQWLPATELQQKKMQQKAKTAGVHSEKHAEGAHHGHHHGAWDMHLWLDPNIMSAYVEQVRDELMIADPQQANTYRENAEQLLHAIVQADTQAAQLLAPVAQHPLLVMHDAWRYLFRHYGLTQGAMVQKTPEQTLGAASIAELEQRLRQGDFRCLVREPQFSPKAMDWLRELAPEMREALADPLGHPQYVGGYPQWLLNQASSIANCLN